MSGPNEPAMNLLGGLFGGAGAKRGPLPTMPIGQTKKRMGDDRIPMSREIPRRNPGQAQDAAARQMGVRPEQLTPSQGSATPRPQAPPVQAPKTPISPDRPAQPPQAPVQAPPPPTLPRVPLPQERPQPEVNPRAMSGRTPMPQERPIGADVGSMLGALKGGPGDAATGAMMAKALEQKMQPQPDAQKPINTFPYFDVAGMLGFGGQPNQPSASSAMATPSPAKPSDPFSGGAAPVQAGPEQLMQVIAAAKMAAERKAPAPTPPTQASPSVTPPVPPNEPIPPPPSAAPYVPSKPSFQGYEIRDVKPKKGEEKHGQEKALKKENSPYYYTRIGVRPGDNAGVAQRLREVRAKAENPRTARTMTPEEDRILAQYNEKDSYLMSMLPEDVAKRMQQYKSGQLTGQIPDRYQERPPGVDAAAGAPTPLKLPPKTTQKKDAAEIKANDAIQNPPKRNDTDKDEETVVHEE